MMRLELSTWRVTLARTHSLNVAASRRKLRTRLQCRWQWGKLYSRDKRTAVSSLPYGWCQQSQITTTCDATFRRRGTVTHEWLRLLRVAPHGQSSWKRDGNGWKRTNRTVARWCSGIGERCMVGIISTQHLEQLDRLDLIGSSRIWLDRRNFEWIGYAHFRWKKMKSKLN